MKSFATQACVGAVSNLPSLRLQIVANCDRRMLRSKLHRQQIGICKPSSVHKGFERRLREVKSLMIM